jgi:site-specific DNA-methyltransferase (adenine-specific)
VTPRNTILAGDAAEVLAGLAPESVDTIVTSPPYFGLRFYGEEPRQLGLEGSVHEYVESLRSVCRQLARVLKPSGAMWLNLGDSYSRSKSWGAAPKSLLLAPERLLLTLSGDGWVVRNRIVWSKPNPMPDAARDRLAVAHEDVFLLTRGQRYFFDLDAIRIAHTSSPSKLNAPSRPRVPRGPRGGGHSGMARLLAEGRVGHPNGRNPGSVWRIATSSYREAHFATFPETLIERPILASCPERLCQQCGQPWRGSYQRHDGELVRASYQPDCGCGSGFRPGLVLDPFFGSGTVGAVARRLRRDWLGIELNRDYHRLAWQRLEAVDGR